MLRTGFNSAQQHEEQRAANFQGGKFIPYTRLRDDGDMMRFRMVTDSDAEFGQQSGAPHVIVQGDFHRHQKSSSKGRMFWTSTLCTLQPDEKTGELKGECVLCADENRRSTLFMAWVWVYAYYHRAQNPEFNANDPKTADKKWPLVQVGNMKVYREDVNGFVMWQDGFYMWEQLSGKQSRFGTLCDRDYLVIRKGTRGQQKVIRTLEALEVTPLPSEDLMAQAAVLPALEKIATGEVDKMTGEGDAPAPTEVEVPLNEEETAEIEVPIPGFGPPPAESAAPATATDPFDELPDPDPIEGEEPVVDDFPF